MHLPTQTAAVKISPFMLGLVAICLTHGLLAVPLPVQGQNKSPEFAAVSIRPIEAGTPIRAEALGIACRGADGPRQAVTAVKPGIDPVLIAPQGRCVANGVTLLSIIAFAYGISERNISGGPAWLRISGPIGLDPGSTNRSRGVISAWLAKIP